MSWHHLPTAQRDLGKRERVIGPRHSRVLERAGGSERECLKRGWWELARTGQTAPRGAQRTKRKKEDESTSGSIWQVPESGRQREDPRGKCRLPNARATIGPAAQPTRAQQVPEANAGNVTIRLQVLYVLKAKESFFRQRSR